MLQGFERTGLGERIANKLLTVCGSNSLGLAMGLAAAEMLVCPAMPSTTSRAAGIFMPVITSVSKAAGSYPGEAHAVYGPCQGVQEFPCERPYISCGSNLKECGPDVRTTQTALNEGHDSLQCLVACKSAHTTCRYDHDHAHAGPSGPALQVKKAASGWVHF